MYFVRYALKKGTCQAFFCFLPDFIGYLKFIFFFHMTEDMNTWLINVSRSSVLVLVFNCCITVFKLIWSTVCILAFLNTFKYIYVRSHGVLYIPKSLFCSVDFIIPDNCMHQIIDQYTYLFSISTWKGICSRLSAEKQN